MSATQYPILQGEPPELLVHDEPMRCPYLADETARLPLRLPLARISRRQLDARLAIGERRQGRLVYRTSCAACHACEAIRIPVADYQLSRTQRRVQRRGRSLIETEVGAIEIDAERARLYNRHKTERGLRQPNDEPLSVIGYGAMLANSCCESFEVRYRVGGDLIGVAIADRSERALSAVYCYFDPTYSALSPGVYSILFQLELCQRWGLEHLYLGLTVHGCQAMSYKRTYLPHERLIEGKWRRFDRP